MRHPNAKLQVAAVEASFDRWFDPDPDPDEIHCGNCLDAGCVECEPEPDFFSPEGQDQFRRWL